MKSEESPFHNVECLKWEKNKWRKQPGRTQTSSQFLKQIWTFYLNWRQNLEVEQVTQNPSCVKLTEKKKQKFGTEGKTFAISLDYTGLLVTGAWKLPLLSYWSFPLDCWSQSRHTAAARTKCWTLFCLEPLALQDVPWWTSWSEEDTQQNM